MANYTDQDQFAESAFLVDDATDLDAANLNVGPETALDRTRWLFRRLMCVAGCFEASRQQPGGAGGATRLGRGAWNHRRRQWFVGFSTAIYATNAGGAAWRGAWSNSGEGCHCAFINDSISPRFGQGIAIRVLGTNEVHEYNHATDTFSIGPSTMPLASITRWEAVLHEPIADTWIALGFNAGAPYVATSDTSAIGFTARTPPAGGTTSGFLCTDGAGNTLFQHKALGIARSTDGGVTWAEVLPAPVGGSSITGLCWDAWRQRFVMVVALAAGGSRTYTSTDGGLTWSVLGTSSLAFVWEPVSVGPLIVAFFIPLSAGVASAIVSHDGGATWTHTGGFDLVSSAPCLAAGPSDVLATNTGSDQKGFSFARGFAPAPI